MEQLELWETLAARKEKEWRDVWGNNATTGPHLYQQDVVPYKHIVRSLRLKADQPICWGAPDCLDKNATYMCAAGKHETCKQHASECFLCMAERRT